MKRKIDEIDVQLSLQQQDLQLGKLRPADGASFNSLRTENQSLCMSDTRVELLKQLQEWSSNPQRHILWLSGMAGTGKSTIALTMAHRFHSQHKLGGSFFFSRDLDEIGNATRFVNTLAYQLASISPSFRDLISASISNHSDVLRQGLRNQWKELIMEPLASINSNLRPALVFVIDALDECESDDDIRLLLQLFVELKSLKSVSVLITSRPEITIRFGFEHISDIYHRRLDLRDVPREVVERD